MEKKKVIYCALATPLIASPAFSASFNCDKASTTVERLICLDSNLSAQDEILSKTYIETREKLDTEDKLKLKKEQIAWLTERNNCSSAECIKASMNSRIKSLRGGQPLASAASKVEPELFRETAISNDVVKDVVKQPTTANDNQVAKADSPPMDNASLYQAELDRKEELEDPRYVKREATAMLAKVKSILEKDLMTEQETKYFEGILRGSTVGYKGYTVQDLAGGFSAEQLAEFKELMLAHKQRMAERERRASLELRYVSRPNDANKARIFNSCSQMANLAGVWLNGQGYEVLYDNFADFATIFSSAREVSASAPNIKQNFDAIFANKAMPEMQRAVVDYLKVCVDKYKDEEISVQRWQEAARAERREANASELGLR